MISNLSRTLDKIEKRAIHKGIQEGKIEAKKEIAKKLIKMNLTDEQIQEATGLTTEEIKELRKQNIN